MSSFLRRLGRTLAGEEWTWPLAFSQPFNYLLRRLSQTGLRRTLAGGHWAWAALGLAAFALRRARRPVADVRTLRIRPGERIVVGLVPSDTSPGTADTA